MVIVLNDLRQRFLHDSVQGQFVPPHQVPCDSVQRRLLFIKMGVFMDRVFKNQLLSTEKAVFMDKAMKS